MCKGHLKNILGTSLVIQWLIFHTSTLGGTGLIPGWRTKIPHAAQCGPKTRKRLKCHLLAQLCVGMMTTQYRGGSILWVQNEVSSRPEAFPAHARYPSIITNCTSFTSKCPGLDSHVFATALLNLISAPLCISLYLISRSSMYTYLSRNMNRARTTCCLYCMAP